MKIHYPERSARTFLWQSPVEMDTIALRVAARYHRELVSAFIPAKWFKTMKAELAAILKKPLKGYPDEWWYVFRDQMEGFFDRFQREFEAQVNQDLALESVRSRVQSAKSYLNALAEKIDKVGALRNKVDFSDATSYLHWYAVTECHDKMQESIKTLGDLYKNEWTISEDVIAKLVQKTLKGATPEERDALTGEGDRASRVKYDYLVRINFNGASLRALKKSKLDWEPSKWVDRILEMLQANYSEQALQEQGAFREFDLHGIKVIVDDKTVGPNDIKKYVQYMSKAYTLMKAKGFAKAWYGNVFIQCEDCGGVNPNTGGGTGGWYATRPDTVTCFVRPSSFVTELMVHELGHRFWFRQMTSEQRARFADLVKVHTVRRPSNAPNVKLFKDKDTLGLKKRLDELQKNGMWNIDRARKLDLVRALPVVKDNIAKAIFNIGNDILDVISELDVDKDLGSEVQGLKDDVYRSKAKLVDRSEDITLLRSNEDMAPWLQEMERIVDQIIAEANIYLDFSAQKHNELARKKLEADPATKEWLDSYENNPAPVVPVSNYGKSNTDEAFAEAFSHYVLEYQMSRDQMESFRSVLSSTDPVVESVARRYATQKALRAST